VFHVSPYILKITCLDITGCRIKYGTVLLLLELQIRCSQKVHTQVHTVLSNSRNSNCQCSLYSKKNPIIRIFCIRGWLAVPFNPNMWISTVMYTRNVISHTRLIHRGRKWSTVSLRIRYGFALWRWNIL
jgi:hypothetical protein